MKGECLTCAKVKECPNNISIDDALSGYTCLFYENVSEYVFMARQTVFDTFGYVSGVEAIFNPTTDEWRKTVSEQPVQLYPPAPGTTYTQRKAQFESTLFNKVRELAYKTYKRPNGEQLLTYIDASQMPRQEVKEIILAHEIATQAIIDDRSGDSGVPAVPVVQQAVLVEAPLAATLAEQPVVVPPPTQEQEMTQPTIPTINQPPMEQPTPPPMEQPVAAKRTLRARSLGTNVASAASQPPMTIPAGATVVESATVAQIPVPVTTFPAAPVMPTIPTIPQMQPVAQQIPVSGVSPEVATINELSKKIDELTATVAKLTQVVTAVQKTQVEIGKDLDNKLLYVSTNVDGSMRDINVVLTALHHIYANIPGSAQIAAQQKADISDASKFKAFVSLFAAPTQNPR